MTEGVGLFEEMGRTSRHTTVKGIANRSSVPPPPCTEGGDSKTGSGTMEVALTDLIGIKKFKSTYSIPYPPLLLLELRYRIRHPRHVPPGPERLILIEN